MGVSNNVMKKSIVVYFIVLLLLLSAVVFALPQYAGKFPPPQSQKKVVHTQDVPAEIQQHQRFVTPAGLCKKQCTNECTVKNRKNPGYGIEKCVVSCFQERCVPAPKAYGACDAFNKDNCCNRLVKDVLDPDCIKVTELNNNNIEVNYVQEDNTLTVKGEELTGMFVTLESPVDKEVSLNVIGEWPTGTWLHVLVNGVSHIAQTIKSPFSSEITTTTLLVNGTNIIAVSNNKVADPYFQTDLALPLNVFFFNCYICEETYLLYQDYARFTPKTEYISESVQQKYDGASSISYNFSFDATSSDQYLRSSAFNVTPGNYTLVYYYKFSDDFVMPFTEDFMNSLWIQLDVNTDDPNVYGERSYTEYGYDYFGGRDVQFINTNTLTKELMLNLTSGLWIDENVWSAVISNTSGFDKVPGVDVMTVEDAGNGWHKLTVSNIVLPLTATGMIMTYPFCYNANCQGSVYIDNVQFYKQGDSTNVLVNPSFESTRPQTSNWYIFDCYDCKYTYLDFSKDSDGYYPDYNYINLTQDQKLVADDSYQWNLNLNPINADAGILRGKVLNVAAGTYSLYLYYKTSSDYSVTDQDGLWFEVDLQTDNPKLTDSDTGWVYYSTDNIDSSIRQSYTAFGKNSWQQNEAHLPLSNVITVSDKGDGWSELRVDNVLVPLDTNAVLMVKYTCPSQSCAGTGYVGGAALVQTL